MTDDLHALRGKRVAVDPVEYPNWAGQMFTIHDAQSPRGATAVFFALKDSAGKRLPKWIRESELMPAPASPIAKETVMPEQTLISMANKIAADKRIDLGSATKEAATLLLREAEDWRASIRSVDASSTLGDQKPGGSAFAERVRQKMVNGLNVEAATEATLAELTGQRQGQSQPVVSLSVRDGESFDSVAMRYAAEHKLTLREAISEVGRLRPDLAQAR